MAKVKKKDKDASKWKKKKWYQILATKTFNEQPLGQTSTFEPSKVLGKTLNVNLMNLTGEMRNQNINVKFKVKEIKDNIGKTEIIGYTLSPAFIKRVVRRRHTRIDATYDIKTRDKRDVKIKPLIITRNLVTRSDSTIIRNKVQEIINEHASRNNYDEFFRMITFYKLQLDMRKRISKLYPLKTFEIKKLILVEPKEEMEK